MRSGARVVIAACASLAWAASEAQALDTVRVESEPLGRGLYLLVAEGDDATPGNRLVSIGADGVLLVDDRLPAAEPSLQAAIARLGGGAVDFVIATHRHVDSAGGKLPPRSAGAWLIAQENSRPKVSAGLPVISFDTKMHMVFNGDRIDLVHVGPAHTLGDTAVIFRDRNLVHLGDVFTTSAYPVIDADNGGSLDGLIAFSEAILGEIEPRAVVIPGHGPVSDYDGLAAYIAMLKTVRARMSSLVDSGATLEQVIAARPSSEWDGANGDPRRFLDGAYAGMTRRASP